MKRIFFAFICTTTISINSQALTLDGYEKLTTEIQKNPKTNQSQKIAVNSYLSGVAETLVSLQGSDGKIALNQNGNLCIPKDIEINADFIKKFADEPLKKPEIYKNNMGEKWKNIVLTDYITGIMINAFNCK